MTKSIKYSHAQVFLFNGLFTTLTTGVFLNDYLLRIGFQPYDFGLFYSVLYLNGLIAFPFSFFVSSMKKKKGMYLIFLFISLSFFLIFISVPYLFGPGSRLIVWISILSIGLCYISMRIGHLILIPWMFDVVGNEKWVKFFFVRMIITYIIPVLVTVSFGGLLKIDGIPILSIMFLIALLTAALGVICMAFFPEGNHESTEQVTHATFSVIYKRLASNRNAIHILMYCILFYYGIGLFIPAVYPYLVNRMGMENTILYKYQVLMLLASLVSTLGAAKICERKNNITALLWFSSVMWFVPAFLLLLPLSKYFLSGLLYILGIEYGYGLIFAGVFVTLTNVSLQYIPKADHVIFLASIELVRSLFTALGSLTFGFIVEHSVEIDLYIFSFNGYEILFTLSLTLLLTAFLVTKRIKQMNPSV